jgi:hypothetical protein
MRTLVGKPERRRQLARPSHRCKVRINMDLLTGRGLDLHCLGQVGWWAVTNRVGNLRVL